MRPNDIHNYATQHLPEALRIVQTSGYAAAHPELTPAEKALVYYYTEDGYEALNASLHVNPTAPLAAFGQGLVAVLGKLPPHVGEAFSGVMLRPAELQFYRACAQTGTPVHWPAFLSASLKNSVAMQFLRTSGKNCLFVIQSKRGRLIEAVAKYGIHGVAPGQNEYEVLFSPQTRFDVLAVEEVLNSGKERDYMRITLDEL